ncbi:anthranilate phosphoribosyltransferase TrpD [Calocera viscosa TUFC12733]|uniref:Anthranilate phosphoribosyltransferase n=1 Tax=Calocera viscosa (strain TUFC12733) TaxID=1330018 RepID=A0A167MM27_CALVF|nr:anthranilate phosphoribosyltransferase TrpD [Calocera viscosa TUFC12733]
MTKPTTLSSDSFKPLLNLLVNDRDAFGAQQAYEATHHLATEDGCTPAQAAAFLTSLKLQNKEDQPEIIAACAKAMREHAIKVDMSGIKNEFPVDIVGTGGDGHDTFNVSTSAGIVAAGAGARVTKHGNKAATSSSGSADLLLSLGCSLNIPPTDIPALLPSTPFIFFFAPLYHPSFAHVGPTRRALPFRTIFNILGPLLNPGYPKGMIVGVAEHTLGPAFAEGLRLLGVERALVVCGKEGLDEISIAGETWAWQLENGVIRNITLHPTRDFGLPTHPLSTVRSSSPDANASLLLGLITPSSSSPEVQLGDGTNDPEAVRDYILLNSAALLVIAGKASTWKEGVKLARESMESGSARKALDAFVKAGKEHGVNVHW